MELTHHQREQIIHKTFIQRMAKMYACPTHIRSDKEAQGEDAPGVVPVDRAGPALRLRLCPTPIR